MRKLRYLRPYTLIELMCVIFFIALLSGFGLKYYYHFHYSYRSSIDNAIRMRRIMTIDKRWKKVFEEIFKQAPQLENGNIVFSKNDYVRLGEKEIIINYRKKKYLLRLPKNTSAAFAIEKGLGDRYLLILNLNWKHSHATSRKIPDIKHSVRIVSLLTVEGGKSYE